MPHASDNPLGSDTGSAEMMRLTEKTGVSVRSVCADYYMVSRLVADGAPVVESVKHLQWLIERAALLKIRYMVLPFVDQSSLRSIQDRAALHMVLRDLLPLVQAMDVELHLETDLNPTDFSQFLAQHNHPYLRANYDIGNSASLGFDPEEELMLLGPWLGSVHVKDRVLGGGTVPLGSGSADFPTSFTGIQKAGFNRWYILQAARGQDGDEVALARKNRQFVENQLASIIQPGRN
ncbi:MAG: sugar phosphate isomerase/epimerase [Magnetococcus sp. YQC-5]